MGLLLFFTQMENCYDGIIVGFYESTDYSLLGLEKK